MKHNWLSVSGTSVPKLGPRLRGSEGKARQRSLPSGGRSPSGMAAAVAVAAASLTQRLPPPPPHPPPPGVHLF